VPDKIYNTTSNKYRLSNHKMLGTKYSTAPYKDNNKTSQMCTDTTNATINLYHNFFHPLPYCFCIQIKNTPHFWNKNHRVRDKTSRCKSSTTHCNNSKTTKICTDTTHATIDLYQIFSFTHALTTLSSPSVRVSLTTLFSPSLGVSSNSPF
jgi:hypothetical protein